MNILMLILGMVVGFLIKLIFDFYHKFLLKQEESKSSLDVLIAKIEAIELTKEKNF
jgi:hypothetical protein